MQPLQWERRPDGLRAPALVCAFKGWNDAGDAASAALTFVGSALGAQRFAVIDPEEFFDFQSTRPQVRITEGRSREIMWPEVEIYEARVPRAPRDLVLLSGDEPSYRWKGFCRTIVDLAEALGVQMVVTLGALLADVPHTRPTVGHRPGLRRHAGRPPGPAGHRLPGPDRDHRRPARRLRRRRHPRREPVGDRARTTSPRRPTRRPRSRSCASSRASSASPSTPRDLETAASEYERQVDVAVQSDPDVQAFVERLEQASAEEPEPTQQDVPSGDVLAREFQRFLRQRGE